MMKVPPELQTIVNGLLQKECWKVAFSYGDELVLHLGNRVPYNNPKMMGCEKGEWILGTLGSEWTLECGTEQICTSNQSPEITKERLRHLENTRVTALQIQSSDLSLRISFDGDYHLLISDRAKDNDPDLATWELFMPDHRLLRVGPGKTWSHTSSRHHK